MTEARVRGDIFVHKISEGQYRARLQFGDSFTVLLTEAACDA